MCHLDNLISNLFLLLLLYINPMYLYLPGTYIIHILGEMRQVAYCVIILYEFKIVLPIFQFALQ